MPESPSGPQKTETPSHEKPTGAKSTMGPSISGQLSQRLDEFRTEMNSALETAADTAVSEVLKTISEIDGANTQSEILQALLEGAVRFASRAAFFLTRPDKIRGWAGEGFGLAGSRLEGLELDYEGSWSALATGSGALLLSSEDCATLSSKVDADGAQEGLLIPFVLRGQLGGGLYADRLPGDRSLSVSSLLLLTHTASQALETAVFRSAPSPSLRLSESVAAAPALRLWQEAPSEPAQVSPPTPEAETPEEKGIQAEATEPIGETPKVETEPPEPEEASREAPREEMPDKAVPEPVREEVPTRDLEAPSFEMPEDSQDVAPEDDAEAADFGFETSEAVPEPLEEELAAEPEPELEDTSTDIWALEEDEDSTLVTEPPLEPALLDDVRDAATGDETPSMPIVGQETVRLDVAALQGHPSAELPSASALQEFQAPTEETAPAEVEYELESVEEPSVEPGDARESSVAEPASTDAYDDSEEPTIITSQPLATSAEQLPEPKPVAVPPTSGYVPPAPPAESTTAGSSTEVRPPADLQGPGSAFAHSPGSSAEIASNEEALHEEARRLARLLVSEIKLYNEEIIEEGRRNGDIYERLKDDIDRSRQMYEERIDPRLHGKENYFRQELVQRLAGGDEVLLGM